MNARPPKDKERNIVDKDFAVRFEKACDDHPHIPQKNHGRLGYIVEQFRKVARDKISVETVRKWFYGEARPRPTKMKILARILEVDEAWLSLGRAPEMAPRERQKRDVALGGAADLIAAIIQMDGGTVTIPKHDDPRAAYVHVYAIVKGAMYAIHAALDSGKGKEHQFAVPAQYADCTVIGVIRSEGTNFDLVELSTEAIGNHGIKRGGFLEVGVTKATTNYFAVSGKEKTKLTTISSFSNRI